MQNFEMFSQFTKESQFFCNILKKIILLLHSKYTLMESDNVYIYKDLNYTDMLDRIECKSTLSVAQ